MDCPTALPPCNHRISRVGCCIFDPLYACIMRSRPQPPPASTKNINNHILSFTLTGVSSHSLPLSFSLSLCVLSFTRRLHRQFRPELSLHKAQGGRQQRCSIDRGVEPRTRVRKSLNLYLQSYVLFTIFVKCAQNTAQAGRAATSHVVLSPEPLGN